MFLADDAIIEKPLRDRATDEPFDVIVGLAEQARQYSACSLYGKILVTPEIVKGRGACFQGDGLACGETFGAFAR